MTGAERVEPDIEVKKPDQMKINKFSKLNMQFQELEEEIEVAKKEVQTLSDAQEEVRKELVVDYWAFGRVYG